MSRFSAPCTVHLYTPGKMAYTHFSQRLGRPQSHSLAARIKYMKNVRKPIRNYTSDTPGFSVVPQPTSLTLPQPLRLKGEILSQLQAIYIFRGYLSKVYITVISTTFPPDGHFQTFLQPNNVQTSVITHPSYFRPKNRPQNTKLHSD
jgi:hypothetical protein